MAGAHLGGLKGALNAIRGKGNAKDMYNSSVLEYMKRYSQMNKPSTTSDS